SAAMYEALAEGVPLTCSDIPSIPEGVREAALLFDPDSVEDIASALRRIVFEPGLREHLREASRKMATRYSVTSSVRRYLGLYEAINKGFAKTSGEVMAWLNSDDMYLPWAFSCVGEVFRAFPQVEWVTTAYPVALDERGRAVECRSVPAYHRDAFFRGRNLAGDDGSHTGYIQQESTFWRRSLWERAGGYVDTSLSLAADFELWARFFRHAELYTVHALLGGFRQHGEQKTAGVRLDDYRDQAMSVLRRHGGRP